MTGALAPDSIELNADDAASFLLDELSLAADNLARGDTDAALDAWVRALGLALQLGPAPTRHAIAALLDGARDVDARTLATLGPALVQLEAQVREAGVLPANPVMASWADVVRYAGMLIGLAGVAGAMPAGDRQGMVGKVRAAAAHLDEETEGLFNFGAWVDEVVGGRA